MKLIRRKPQPPPAADHRCKAIRYNGERCRLPAGPDGYCGAWNHTAQQQTAERP